VGSGLLAWCVGHAARFAAGCRSPSAAGSVTPVRSADCHVIDSTVSLRASRPAFPARSAPLTLFLM
jgi:hypothetical protein